MNMRRIGKILALLLILPAVMLAQNGVVRGRIADAAGAPLARALVSAEGSGLRATSDDQGRYEIRGLSSGAYLLRVRLLGYQPRTARVVVDQAPVTLRGLSPDETLVLINGWRRHQMALVNTFAYGMGAGTTGVDLNAIPSSAIDRIDVLRDGASAQYGSDAIAGVVNMVLKEGQFTPFLNTSIGRYHPDNYADDGTTANLNGGWGIGLGRGSLGLFGEFLDLQPTNRAWADFYEDAGTGVADSVVNGRVILKRNPVAQPNHH